MASLFDLLGDDKETTSKSIISGLFGLSPDLVAQQQAASNLQSSQQAALQYAQMDPFQRANYAMFQGASGATGGILNALGAENPAVTKAKEGAVLKQKISQLPLGTVEGQQQAFNIALEAGRPDIAIQLRDVFLKQGLTQAKTEAALKEKLPTAAKELIAAGYTPESPEFQAKMRQIIEADITGKAKGSGSSTSVTIDAGSLAKAMGVDVGKQAAGIEGKYSALDSLKEAKKMLKSGIYAGAYGPEQMAAAKYTLGAAGSKQRVENTEQFMSHIGNVVIPRLQEFGGNDSVEELRYLQRVMGGEQRLEPKSLERILDAADRKINRGIERVQSQTQAAGKKAPPPLGPGASRETEQKTPRKVFNPATGKIEVQ